MRKPAEAVTVEVHTTSDISAGRVHSESFTTRADETDGSGYGLTTLAQELQNALHRAITSTRCAVGHINEIGLRITVSKRESE